MTTLHFKGTGARIRAVISWQLLYKPVFLSHARILFFNIPHR